MPNTDLSKTGECNIYGIEAMTINKLKGQSANMQESQTRKSTIKKRTAGRK